MPIDKSKNPFKQMLTPANSTMHILTTTKKQLHIQCRLPRHPDSTIITLSIISHKLVSREHTISNILCIIFLHSSLYQTENGKCLSQICLLTSFCFERSFSPLTFQHTIIIKKQYPRPYAYYEPCHAYSYCHHLYVPLTALPAYQID